MRGSSLPNARPARTGSAQGRTRPYDLRWLMPKIQWAGVPPALRDHLFDRLRERKIPTEGVERVRTRRTGWTLVQGLRNLQDLRRRTVSEDVPAPRPAGQRGTTLAARDPVSLSRSRASETRASRANGAGIGRGPRERARKGGAAGTKSPRQILVRKGGFEPPRSCERQPLKQPRARITRDQTSIYRARLGHT
jgi:hypothetical protein